MRWFSTLCCIALVGLLAACDLFSEQEDSAEKQAEYDDDEVLDEALANIDGEATAPEFDEVAEIDEELAAELFDEHLRRSTRDKAEDNSEDPGRTFSVGLQRLDDEQWRTVFHAPQLADVEVLELTDERIDDELVAELARSEHVGKLEELRLADNDIGDSGIAALADAEFPVLEVLILDDNDITDVGARALAQAEGMPNLEELGLENNVIGDAGATVLVHGELVDDIERLQISANPIGVDGIAALGASPRTTGLRHLSIGRLELDDEDFAKIAGAPAFEGLDSLELEGNNLTSAGVEQLVDTALFEGLDRLVIERRVTPETYGDSRNEIGDEGIATLATSPGVGELGVLVAEEAAIGPDGAAAIAESEYLGDLELLGFSGNSIGDEGVEALVESERLDHLLFADLSDNDIASEGAAALAASELFERLYFVHLGGNQLDVDDIDRLFDDNDSTEFLVTETPRAGADAPSPPQTAPTYTKHIRSIRALERYRDDELRQRHGFAPGDRDARRDEMAVQVIEGFDDLPEFDIDDEAIEQFAEIDDSEVAGFAGRSTESGDELKAESSERAEADEEHGEPDVLDPEVIPQDPAEADGPLDAEIVQRVTRQNRREIQDCYERGLQHDPDLAGRIELEWTITEEGNVSTATIGESTMDSDDIEECLTPRIERWSFPSPDGGHVDVSYAFDFDA